MIDGSLRSKVNASSWISYKYHPDMAFLNSSSAWCAKTSHQNQYIQVCSRRVQPTTKTDINNETMAFISI